ncbi:S8 family serine peptidase [Streptomyces sp. NPDC001941]|uniref:S8 family serine peptidase n=1 Tax=Streptomyces sp. NPDC001941 TaxID=3154659 RepID=UPI003323FF11
MPGPLPRDVPPGRLRAAGGAALAVGLTLALTVAAAPARPAAPDPGGASEKVVLLLRDQSAARRTSADLRAAPEVAPARRQSAEHASLLADLRSGDATGTRSLSLVDAVATTVTPAQLSRLRSDPRVAAVVPDALVSLAPPARTSGPRPGPAAARTPARVCPADPRRPLVEPEGLELTRTLSPTGAPDARDLADGRGVTVGVLGGSIDRTTPDLMRGGASVVTRYKDFTGEGTDAPGFIIEAFGNAGTIAAQGTTAHDLSGFVSPSRPLPPGCTVRIEGVAPGADLAVQKVFSSVAAPVSTILAAIDWSVVHDRVDVLNESLAAYTLPDTAADAIRTFNAAAVRAGVTVVVASGNAGPHGTFSSPATDPEVIGVGASTQGRTYAQTGAGGYPLAAGGWANDQVSALSSGGTAQERPRTVDLVAPGDTGWTVCSPDVTRFLSCRTPYRGFEPSPFVLFNGTSEAAPFVSGAAALVIQAYRDTHQGRTPAPESVKHILMSTARDLGAPAADQGAGLLDAYAAVRLARAYGGAKEAGAPSLLVHSDGLDLTGRPGEQRRTSVRVTNTGAAPVTVSPAVRTPGVARALADGEASLAAGRVFTDADGSPARAVAVPFSVAPGTDRLVADVAWRPGAGAVTALTLVDPRGRFAAYSLPFGSSGYGRATVSRPLAGAWTAYAWAREDALPREPVRYAVSASTSVTHSAGPALTLRPGQSADVGAVLRLPERAGDGDASLLLSAGGSVRAAVPVGLRALVPLTPRGGSFTGVLAGGNGLLVNALLGGQTLAYQFDVAPGRPALTATLRTSAPGYDLRAVLVSPDGMPVTLQDAPGGDGTVRVVNGPPVSGRWTLLVVVNGKVMSGRTRALLSGTIGFEPVPVRAKGLPVSAATRLPAGRPVTATVAVTNNGPVPLEVFADARLDRLQEVALRSTVPVEYRLPGTTPDRYPQFLVPADSTRLAVTATSSQPLVLDTQPYVNGFYVGDPDVPGTVGTTARTVVAAPVLAPTTWVCDANLAGPFDGTGTEASVACAASALTRAFDPAAASSTGDPWRTGSTFRPVTVAPGATASVTVTLTPGARPGSRVSGYVGLGTWNPRTGFAMRLGQVPYAYTVR